MDNIFISEVDIDKILRKAIDTFGKQAQLMQACEELAELQVECSKLARGICKISNLHKEIADCRIMLRQIELISGVYEASGQLCVAIEERDALIKLDEMLTTMNVFKDRDKALEETLNLKKQGELLSAKNAPTKTKKEKDCADNIVDKITKQCHISTNKPDELIGNYKIGVDYADGLATLTAQQAYMNIGKDANTKPTETCENCIFRSNSKKDNSFIDLYWCSKICEETAYGSTCKDFVKRD